jgi:phosphoinositide-3-kinase regulatory subunit 4
MYFGLMCNNEVLRSQFLFQGLTDPEEFVVVKVIEAMTSLTKSGLLQKSSLYDLLNDVACFLVHPNLWIRQVIFRSLNIWFTCF